jgi:putative DNA primase/helicase
VTNDFLVHVEEKLGAAPLLEHIIPGEIIRFSTNGIKTDKAGWCKLFQDGKCGVFGDFRRGISEGWQAHEFQSAEERARFQEKIKQAQAEASVQESEERTEAQSKINKLWEGAQSANPEHEYLVAKKIGVYGIRQKGKNLFIPVKDIEGNLRGLQSIGPAGDKKFEYGTIKKGHFHLIGEFTDKLLIAEGYATGATVHEITGFPVVVAFDAGNLKPAAEAFRKRYHKANIIICADDDYKTEGNPGLTAARDAAATVGGAIAVPNFSGNRGNKDTDFNDMARLSGPGAVKISIEGACRQFQSRIRIVDINDFIAMKFPPNECILSPWLPRQGLAMIYAPRGIGKTFVSLSIAFAVASGSSLFSWSVPKPRSVLFIDGEMPASVLQERLAKIIVSNDLQLTAQLHVLTPDLQPSGMIDLSRAEDQRDLERHLDGMELIIVDNLSTLCRTGKENEGEGWYRFRPGHFNNAP